MPLSDASLLTPTVAEIDLRKLRSNVRALQRQAGGVPLMGVVKANAYGHGAIRVAETLQAEGVRHFAVATLPEALQLRAAGIDAPVLIFASPLPEFLPEYAQHGLDVTVASTAIVPHVLRTAQMYGTLRTHLKVDTGMHRIGVQPGDVVSVVRQLEGAPGVELAGLWTHFATATQHDDAFAHTQLDRFEAVYEEVGDAFERVHTAHSGALLTLPDSLVWGDRALARIGIALYGLASPKEEADRLGLEPVMRLTSRVTHVKTIDEGETVSYDRTWTAPRPSRIATVGAGYADGYPRLLSNRAQVAIRGQRHAVAGTVCMDMFMVDLGEPDGPGSVVEVGDEVVLFGDGGPSTRVVAGWADTIPYEICCGIAARVPRRYSDDPRSH